MTHKFLSENKLLLRFIILVVMLASAAYVLDWQVVRSTVNLLDPWNFVLAILVLVPIHVILGWRWYFIVRSNVNLPFLSHLRGFLISVFLTTVAPGSVGGDLYRFFALKSGSVDRWLLVGAIARERIIGVAGVSLFYLICYFGLNARGAMAPIPPGHVFDIVAVALMVGLLGLIPAKFAVARVSKIHAVMSRAALSNFLRLISHGLDMGSLKWITGMTLVSLFVCGLWVGSIYIIDKDLEVLSMPLWGRLMVFGMVGILTELVRMVPISFQGIGVREWAFAYLMTAYGVNFDIAFVFGAAAYLAMSASILFAGLVGALLPVGGNFDHIRPDRLVRTKD